MPLLWEHEQRVCAATGKHPLQEFIQRALIVTVVPDGILDLYYYHDHNHNNALVSFQFSVCQGRQQQKVWHWFMYFCRNDYCKAGIWWHGALLAIERGRQLKLNYTNAQTHQSESKLHAGYSLAAHNNNNNNGGAGDADILSQLHPLAFTTRIPRQAINVRLWDPPPRTSS
jgi:hypothetical protein